MNYLIVRTISVVITSYLTGVGVALSMSLSTGWVAFLVMLFLAVVNHIIKPMLSIIFYPVTILTLGLFSFIINGLMIYLASYVISGFSIPSFMMAIWFSIVLSIVNTVLHIFE